jgi:hypothetical protein
MGRCAPPARFAASSLSILAPTQQRNYEQPLAGRPCSALLLDGPNWMQASRRSEIAASSSLPAMYSRFVLAPHSALRGPAGESEAVPALPHHCRQRKRIRGLHLSSGTTRCVGACGVRPSPARRVAKRVHGRSVRRWSNCASHAEKRSPGERRRQVLPKHAALELVAFGECDIAHFVGDCSLMASRSRVSVPKQRP